MRTLKFFLPALVLFAFSSCKNFTEEIHLNENGSGKYSIYTDMIPGIIEMAEQMKSLFPDTSKTDSSNNMEEMIWRDFPDVIDSVFDYSDQLPDSVAADPENKKYLRKLQGFMEGGKSKGYVNVGARYAFDDLPDLNGVVKKIGENQKGKGNAGSGMLSSLDNINSDVTYDLKNKIFSRKVKVTKNGKVDAKDMRMIKLFFSDSKMKTLVYVPGKVKSVKGAHILRKESDHVVFEYDFIESLLGNISMDFEITYEN